MGTAAVGLYLVQGALGLPVFASGGASSSCSARRAAISSASWQLRGWWAHSPTADGVERYLPRLRQRLRAAPWSISAEEPGLLC
ncbi:biotin transporter BioY [Paracoccus sp. Z118]|nr:biotin transporter BioY [Paracoccus sp. Z118]